MGFVILISCAAGLGGLLYGCDTAVIFGAIGFLKNLYRLSPFMEGLFLMVHLLARFVYDRY
ncbi:Arabinose-proton symporter [Bacillus paralicheniformis]|nr:Arabinose-proton symporter [Bacillus paralicheniformis]